MSSSAGGIRNTAGGRRILAKIERRFPHFNINEEGSIERAIHRKGALPHEGPPPETAPQRGNRRGPKKAGGNAAPQYQQYRDYSQETGGGAPHGFDPYFMMGGGGGGQRNYDQQRNYDHM